MYICLCNPTTDDQIKDQCKKISTIEELCNSLDICNNCKSCEKEICELFINSR